METDNQISVIYAPRHNDKPITPTESTAQLHTCAICGDVSDGPHFGTIACRACAAFFRRTVSLKLDYVCRANSSCHIDKSARNMCRSCRYQKCLRQGMLITAVQLPRDGIGKHVNAAKPRKEKNFMKKTSDAECVNLIRQPDRIISNDEPSHIIISRNSHTEVCSAHGSEENEVDYLCRMSEGYHHFLAIRRATQTMNGGGSVFKAFCSTGEPQMTNYDEAKRCCKMESHILTDIVNEYFPPFNELPIPDKITIFKNFYSYFAYAARAFATYETFGKNDETDDRILMHEGGFIKLSELEKFYENTVKCTADPKDAARIFLPAQRYILDVIVSHMRQIKMVEAEFLTLIGMLLWNDSLRFSRPDVNALVWKTRDIISSNLYKFHQSQGIVGHEAFIRVTNIMLLLPKVQKAALDMDLNYKMAEIFNICEVDDCCKDFILQ